MAQTTYQVKLSTDGNHSITVTTNDVKATKEAVAWASTAHQKLLERYGTPPAPGSDEPDGSAQEEAPICAVHNLPMVRVHGSKDSFWSCHRRTDIGSFCSYRPPRQ